MSYDFTLTALIPATPQVICDAWLNSRGHTRMTGGEAETSADVGASFAAWDGYITGTNLELVLHAGIVQSRRTTQFTDTDNGSKITVTLVPAQGATRLILEHTNVPDGQTSYEKGGWQDHYFEPMEKYFDIPDRAPVGWPGPD